jgi:hypothetical protein
MKRIRYGDDWWLMGDDAAAAVLDLAVLLAKHDSASSIQLRVLDDGGSVHTVSFLIGPATMMTSETITTAHPEPDNTDAVLDIRAQMERITSPPNAVGTGDWPARGYFDEV